MVARDVTDTWILHLTIQWICSHISEEKFCLHLHIPEVEARLYSDILKIERHYTMHFTEDHYMPNNGL